jgi:arylsulfatase A-like enzyme
MSIDVVDKNNNPVLDGGSQITLNGSDLKGQTDVNTFEDYDGSTTSVGTYVTDHMTAITKFLIANHVKETFAKGTNTPFYYFFGQYGVHTPFEAQKEDKDVYDDIAATNDYSSLPYRITEWNGAYSKRRIDNTMYAGMIKSVDDSMQEILDWLDALDIANDTMVVFWSDHGSKSSHGGSYYADADMYKKLASTNFPLRAGKGWCYEGGIRIPYIIKWPGIVSPGTVCNDIVSTMDLFPTFLDAAGAALAPTDHVDGESLIEPLNGNSFTRSKPLFWHEPVARPTSTGEHNYSAVREGDYKLIEWYDDDRIELYNIKLDPGEHTNLADTEFYKAQDLRIKLHRWRDEANAVTKAPSVISNEYSYSAYWDLHSVNVSRTRDEDVVRAHANIAGQLTAILKTTDGSTVHTLVDQAVSAGQNVLVNMKDIPGTVESGVYKLEVKLGSTIKYVTVSR